MALVWPDITALALVLWIAVWAVVTGMVEVALAFRQAAAGERTMWALTGLVLVALGVMVLALWRSDLAPRLAWNAYGVTARSGWRVATARWADVDSVSMDPWAVTVPRSGIAMARVSRRTDRLSSLSKVLWVASRWVSAREDQG